MRPILYTTDYSENSVPALKMAYALSKKFNSKLIVLHVFDLNVALVTPLSMTYAKKEKETFIKHRETLQEFCETHLGVYPDKENLQVEVRENALINDAIMDAINDFNAFLVVMGLKGKGAIRDAIVGSSTKGMIDKSPCPILAVPAATEKYTFENITYATDFEETDVWAMDWLVKMLAAPFEAFIQVVHVATKDEYAGEDQMQWFQEMLHQKVSYEKMDFKMIHSEDIFDALLSEVDQLGTDLVVMLEREKSSFLGLFTRPDMVKRMMTKANLPLLSMNRGMFT